MYFGLMGEGQPIGRYDDMWAGWCSKVRHMCVACSAGEALPPAPCGARVFFQVLDEWPAGRAPPPL